MASLQINYIKDYGGILCTYYVLIIFIIFIFIFIFGGKLIIIL